MKENQKEIKKTQSEFYGRIIEIFSIFVAIFTFIIVGFGQVPSIVDKSLDWWMISINLIIIFILIVSCIAILLFLVNRIIRK